MVKRMTIPEIRHCLHVLATELGGEQGELLHYLAEQTRRAPRAPQPAPQTEVQQAAE